MSVRTIGLFILGIIAIFFAIMVIIGMHYGCWVFSYVCCEVVVISLMIYHATTERHTLKLTVTIIAVFITATIALILYVTSTIILYAALATILLFILASYLVIKILEKKKEAIIKELCEMIEISFGPLYGLLILISTAGFLFAYVMASGNWAIAILIFVLLEIESLFYFAIPVKEKIRSREIKILIPLFVFLIATLILIIYYLGLVEIVMLIIAILTSAFAIWKVLNARDN